MLGQMLPEITPSLFLLTFVEGFLAFLSPCILPLLPIYLMYLSGSDQPEADRKRLLINSLGFIAGFTLVFVLLGATASSLGGLLVAHRVMLQRVSGVVMIIFGINYLGVVNIPFLNKTGYFKVRTSNLRFFSSLLFGAAFSFGWTPCLGAFLGSALLLASNASTLYQGSLLLLLFSFGLGIPFLITALLWHRLQGAMDLIKRNIQVIKLISGGLLIVVGLLMLFNLFGYYANIFL